MSSRTYKIWLNFYTKSHGDTQKLETCVGSFPALLRRVPSHPLVAVWPRTFRHLRPLWQPCGPGGRRCPAVEPCCCSLGPTQHTQKMKDIGTSTKDSLYALCKTEDLCTVHANCELYMLHCIYMRTMGKYP